MKLQTYPGGYHDTQAKAMPKETLIVHVPDPYKSCLIKVNNVTESRYGEVLAVGDGPHPGHAEGDIVVLDSVTAGIAVKGLYHQNRLVHRVMWRSILAVVEDLPSKDGAAQ